MTTLLRPMTCLAVLTCLLGGCADRSDGGQTVVRVANWGSPAVEPDFMSLERRLWDQFEAMHPGTRVRVEQIPGPGLYAPKLIMMHVAGSMPDLMHLDASYSAVFMDNDILLDLVPFLDKDPSFDLGAYYPNVVDVARRGDKLYAIPIDFTPMVMYYNKTLFDAFLFRMDTPTEMQAAFPYDGERDPYHALPGTEVTCPAELRRKLSEMGIEISADTPLCIELAERVGSDREDPVYVWRWGFLHDGQQYTLRREESFQGAERTESLAAYRDEAIAPYPSWGWTWEEFLDTCQRLMTAEGARATYGMSFENWMPAWVLWLWSNGADVLGPVDAVDGGFQATGYFDSPHSIEALQFLVDLSFRHKVAPTLQEREKIGQDPFLNADAAMDIKGHWLLIDIRARRFDVGVTTIPTNHLPPQTVMYEAGLAITRKAERPDLAWKYITFFTNEEVQRLRMAPGIGISANQKAAAYYVGTPIEDAFQRAVAISRPPWGTRVEGYEFCEDLGREMMETIHFQGRSVDEAMRETARLIDATLRR